ncbi:class I SAM-dependent methyltransferase [Actinophytocola glycyrrhizae]|uniref:Class I SAM-dependent methyltransferase n=1 Tax=Actinophytocola glycyrrhizae TaxID=2044873 RepID=A0ABV9SBR5_9PSEU
MATFDPRLYGARWADEYDEWHKGLMDDEGAVAALADLAADGPALEFGVGTGRLAVPLAERGVEVVGVDISPEMLAKLKAKTVKVTTVEGDMTTVSLDREFAVAFIAFNSIFVLESQEEQVELFRNAARHLRPGGRFVLETVVIKPPSDDRGKLSVVKVEADRVTLAGGTNDPVTGNYSGMWMVVEPSGTRFYPLGGRSVPHHEMDLMAQLAGLEREARWSDWKGTPFGPKSELHVSIYRKP